MSVRVLLILMLAATGLVAGPAASAFAQQPPPPPLFPGEVVYPLADGCSLIARAPRNATELQRRKDYFRTARWTGRCLNGLAHGVGVIATPSEPAVAGRVAHTRFYGRAVGIMPAEISPTNTNYIAIDGRVGEIGPQAYQPVWPTRPNDIATRVYFDGRTVWTTMKSCVDVSPRPSGCNERRPSNVLGVSASGGGVPSQHRTCPKPTSARGCDVVWRELAGPVIRQIEALAAEVRRDSPAYPARLAAMNADRDRQYAALDRRREAEQRQAAARPRPAPGSANAPLNGERASSVDGALGVAFSRLDLPGVRGRHECIQPGWMTSASRTAYGRQVNSPDSFGPGPRNEWRDRKVLVLSNKCPQRVVVYAMACGDVSHPQPHARGPIFEEVAMGPNYWQGGRPDLVYQLFQQLIPVDERRGATRPTRFFYGAWDADTMPSDGAAYALLVRKVNALRKFIMEQILQLPPNSSFHEYASRSGIGASCQAFNPQSVSAVWGNAR